MRETAFDNKVPAIIQTTPGILNHAEVPYIVAKVKVSDRPLMLHVTYGVPNKSLRESISRGISKINIATELKIPMMKSIGNMLVDNSLENNLYKYIANAKMAVKEVVKEKIRFCRCNNKAWTGIH